VRGSFLRDRWKGRASLTAFCAQLRCARHDNGKHADTLGQYTHAVLQMLRFDPREIDRLCDAGVVEEAC
jgi:crotonobetainyl-CoA:carnitine CoA-transferase CaiB-like acyl-CoA transferase